MDDTTRAMRFLETGDYRAAEELLRRILCAEPDSHEVLNKLGICLTWQDRPDEALECFDRCIAIRPSYPNAYSNKANVLKEKGQLDEALALYEKALAADASYATAYHNLGVLHKQMGHLDKAIPLLKKAARVSAREVVRGREGTSRAKTRPVLPLKYALLLGVLAGLIISIFASRR